jgi:hypothetical protein
MFREKSIAFLFGNKNFSIVPSVIASIGADTLLNIEPFSSYGNGTNIKKIVFARQKHSVQGLFVDEINSSQQLYLSLSMEADYLVTSAPYVALGVFTADCLPIILYDNKNHAVALVHAGWRGSVENIALIALQAMQSRYGSSVDAVHVYFGPSARVCCYEVGEEVLDTASRFNFFKHIIKHVNNRYYFDTVLFNQLVLQEAGIPSSAFCLENAVCTIENDQFCSYRRNPKAPERQCTIAYLKDKNH